MFSPRAFTTTDLHWLDLLLERDPFITLLVNGDDGLPLLTRLPVLYRRDGNRIELQGHWARGNPQSRCCGRARVLVDGPHGYVSASWYPDKEAAARVPTWNYAVAELTGSLETFEDTDALAALVAATSDHFEASVGQAWRFQADRDDHRDQLRGIIGFRFLADTVQVKLKLSQNHPTANQDAVVSALEQQPSPASQELARWMRLACVRPLLPVTETPS